MSRRHTKRWRRWLNRDQTKPAHVIVDVDLQSSATFGLSWSIDLSIADCSRTVHLEFDSHDARHKLATLRQALGLIEDALDKRDRLKSEEHQ